MRARARVYRSVRIRLDSLPGCLSLPLLYTRDTETCWIPSIDRLFKTPTSSYTIDDAILVSFTSRRGTERRGKAYVSADYYANCRVIADKQRTDTEVRASDGSEIACRSRFPFTILLFENARLPRSCSPSLSLKLSRKSMVINYTEKKYS